MKRVISLKTKLLFPVAFLSAAVVAPAFANSFYDTDTNIRRHAGSAPSPASHELRGFQHYPAQSLFQSEQGTVGLKISLDEQGSVSDVAVVKSSGFPRLDEAAVNYVKAEWNYDAGDEQQMPKVVQTEVTFKLE